jgi:hypothetical protein
MTVSLSSLVGAPTPTVGSTLTGSVLDDISNQCNGSTSVFNLAINSVAFSTIDSKDIDVFVNGLKLAPYVDNVTYPWITPYDSFTGFRVKSNQLIIYKPPFTGSNVSLVVRSTSSSRQSQRYPFNAMTIALGD